MTKNARECPTCGSLKVARILYGFPDMDDGELKADLEAGRIVLGGCRVSEDNPIWHCVDCGYEWGHRTS